MKFKSGLHTTPSKKMLEKKLKAGFDMRSNFNLPKNELTGNLADDLLEHDFEADALEGLQQISSTNFEKKVKKLNTFVRKKTTPQKSLANFFSIKNEWLTIGIILIVLLFILISYLVYSKLVVQ